MKRRPPGTSRTAPLVPYPTLVRSRQAAADADPLPLAAGKLVGPLVHHVVEADAAEQAESLIDVRLRELAEPAPPDADVAEAPGEHVLHHQEALDQRVLLDDPAHAPARPPPSAGAERPKPPVKSAGGRVGKDGGAPCRTGWVQGYN